MPSVDAIKMFLTYLIALVVIVGGFYFLYGSINREGEAISTLRVLIAGFIGMSLQFAYAAEAQTRTSRQMERQLKNWGANTAQLVSPTPEEPVA